MDAPQIIEIVYNGRRHWFEVWRFETTNELEVALVKDGIRDYPKDVVAYTDCYDDINKDECGRMYLTSKSINTLAHEAVHMALGILSRDGLNTLIITTGPAVEDEEDLCDLTGQITSKLYSQQKYF